MTKASPGRFPTDTNTGTLQAEAITNPESPDKLITPTQPYQVLSMDFSFAGIVSKDSNRRKDILGLNGETGWILAQDVFSKMIHADTRLNKAAPIKWLDKFLEHHKPNCNDKFVFLDQGGELYGSHAARKVFDKHDYTILPTGSAASYQNPCERYHRTLADTIRAMLIGANLPAHFWPYSLHHTVRLLNALPGSTQTESPLLIATGRKDDFTGLKTF